MSDTWYRDAPDLPPYETWDGELWTWDGRHLNPVHGCEEPAWLHELRTVDLYAEVTMGLREAIERQFLGD